MRYYGSVRWPPFTAAFAKNRSFNVRRSARLCHGGFNQMGDVGARVRFKTGYK